MSIPYFSLRCVPTNCHRVSNLTFYLCRGYTCFDIGCRDISMSATPITGEHATTQIGTTIPAGYHVNLSSKTKLAAGSNFGFRRPTATTKKICSNPLQYFHCGFHRGIQRLHCLIGKTFSLLRLDLGSYSYKPWMVD